MILNKIISLLILLLFSNALLAQMELPDSFIDELAKSSLEINIPLENRYKDIKIKENNFRTYDLALWSKKEKLEIRYAIDSFETDTILNQIPHVECMKVISNVATNSDEAAISVHSMSNKELLEEFNADWGAVAYFQPKPEFGEYKHCKMLALFKEGKASAYVFFLFDEASEALDNRFYALQFKK